MRVSEESVARLFEVQMHHRKQEAPHPMARLCQAHFRSAALLPGQSSFSGSLCRFRLALARESPHLEAEMARRCRPCCPRECGQSLYALCSSSISCVIVLRLRPRDPFPSASLVPGHLHESRQRSGLLHCPTPFRKPKQGQSQAYECNLFGRLSSWGWPGRCKGGFVTHKRSREVARHHISLVPHDTDHKLWRLAAASQTGWESELESRRNLELSPGLGAQQSWWRGRPRRPSASVAWHVRQ